MLGFILASEDLEQNLAFVKGWIAKGINFPRYHLLLLYPLALTLSLRMYELQGCQLVFLQRYEEATTAFTKAIEMDSTKYCLYYDRAVAYRKLMRSSESNADYDKYLKFIDPGIS